MYVEYGRKDLSLFLFHRNIKWLCDKTEIIRHGIKVKLIICESNQISKSVSVTSSGLHVWESACMIKNLSIYRQLQMVHSVSVCLVTDGLFGSRCVSSVDGLWTAWPRWL